MRELTAARSPAPNMSATEWETRVEAAAGYRLLDLLKLTDLAEGMVGVRVGGEADAYLIQPYGLFFGEVKASDLIKVRFGEEPDAGRGRPLNYSSCAQVKSILQARADVHCVLHTHIMACSIVASLAGGLMPLNQ